MNGKEVVKKLQTLGWEVARISKGSHYQMKKGDKRATVPVHGTKDLKPGTLANIKRQTGEQL